jgi:hypothetical protein
MVATPENLISFTMTATIVAATLLAGCCKDTRPELKEFGDRFRFFFLRSLAAFTLLALIIWELFQKGILGPGKP